MNKPVKINRLKNEDDISCDECANCEYLGHGDMSCSQKDDDLVYENFEPTENYMWCKNKKFKER